MSEKNRIIFKNVCKNYGETKVVKDLNLDINPGERLVLLGPSGCGKSTTLRMIAGLEDITSGDLYFGNERVNDIASGERNIAMVFQNYALYPHLTVWDNITFGLRMNKVNKNEIDKRAREAIKILRLDGLEKRYPKELSGGQRQRVALCRAVVKQSPFFLLDEPLSNLDVQLRNTSREELVKLHNLYRPTFIYVTHDQIEAMTIGHRIAVMNKGVLQQIDTPEKIYNQPVNIFVAKFIGIPQINIVRVNIVEDEVIYLNNKIRVNNEKKKFLKDRREIYLGIRPEYIKVNREKFDGSMKGNIAKIENYGSQKCTHGIKLIDYIENEKVEVVTGSLIAQYTLIKEKMSKVSTEMKYPAKALLEALKNMILHRDYSYNGDSIIRIYKDRVEFTSLGELIGNLTVEGIRLGISVPRNLSLMKVFQEVVFTKGNGEGIQEILSVYKEYKVKPVFKSIGGVFQVILPKPEYTVNGKVISDKYRRVLEFMEKRGTVSNKEIQEHLELKSTSVVNYLKEMLEVELIEKIREGRNISYKIK